MPPFKSFPSTLLDHIKNLAMDKSHVLVSSHDLRRGNYKTLSTMYAANHWLDLGNDVVIVCSHAYEYMRTYMVQPLKTPRVNILLIEDIKQNILNCSWFQHKLIAQFISIDADRFIGLNSGFVNFDYFNMVNGLSDKEFDDILYAPIQFDYNLIQCNHTRGRMFSKNAKLFFDVDWLIK